MRDLRRVSARRILGVMQNTARSMLTRLALFGLPCLLGGGCDLQTKSWAEETLRDLPQQTMRVFDPWLDLALTYNRGTAFSVLPELGDARWIMGVFALVVALALLVISLRSAAAHRFEIVAFGLIAGGAIGNGIDRMFTTAPGGGTGVVDFVRVNYPWGGAWPAFNVADMLVAVGAGILLVRSWRSVRAREAPAEARTGARHDVP